MITPENEIKANTIRNWRKKASLFSSNDRIGSVMAKSLDLLTIIVKHGTHGQNLKNVIESVDRDREFAMSRDENRELPLRDLIYGLCESISQAFESIIVTVEKTAEEEDDDIQIIEPSASSTSLDKSKTISSSPVNSSAKRQCTIAAFFNAKNAEAKSAVGSTVAPSINIPPTERKRDKPLPTSATSTTQSPVHTTKKSAFEPSKDVKRDNMQQETSTKRKRSHADSSQPIAQRAKRSVGKSVYREEDEENCDDIFPITTSPSTIVPPSASTTTSAPAPASASTVRADATSAATPLPSVPAAHVAAAAPVPIVPSDIDGDISKVKMDSTLSTPSVITIPTTPAVAETSTVRVASASPATSPVPVPAATAATAASVEKTTAKAAVPLAVVPPTADISNVKKEISSTSLRPSPIAAPEAPEAPKESAASAAIPLAPIPAEFAATAATAACKDNAAAVAAEPPVANLAAEVKAEVACFCSPCGKTFNSARGLTQHNARVHSEHQCIFCQCQFMYKDSLEKHIVLDHNDKLTIAPTHNKTTSRRLSMDKKYEDFELGREFRCELCGWKTHRANDFKAHQLRHEGVLSFACNICPAEFSVDTVLKNHLRKAHDVKPYCCSNCGEQFFRHEQLKKHRKASCVSMAAPVAAAAANPQDVAIAAAAVVVAPLRNPRRKDGEDEEIDIEN